MNITFLSGTTRQHDLFNRAMAVALFPWDRISTTVQVEWVDEDNLPNGHNGFAFTSWDNTTNLDSCGRANLAHVKIRDDLDDPNRPGNEGGAPRGHYRGEKFYMECVIHELAHVVQAKFTPAMVSQMCHIFDGTAEDWNEPEAWEEKRQESFAETFKDVWLPRAYRRFTNRTHHHLARERYEAWLQVLDDLCPCGSNRCIESGVTFTTYNAQGTWDLSWIADEADTGHQIGPAYTTETWPVVITGDEKWLRIRFGGTGFDNSGNLYQIGVPNPKFLDGSLTFSITFHFFPEEGLVGYRLNEFGGEDEHWWYDEDEQNLAALPVVVFGVWKQDTGAPITSDLVSKTFDWQPAGEEFVNPQWWFIGSLRICAGESTN